MLESVLLYGHSLSTCRLPRLHREVVTNALLPFLELQRIRMAPLAAGGCHTQLPTRCSGMARSTDISVKPQDNHISKSCHARPQSRRHARGATKRLAEPGARPHTQHLSIGMSMEFPPGLERIGLRRHVVDLGPHKLLSMQAAVIVYSGRILRDTCTWCSLTTRPGYCRWVQGIAECGVVNGSSNCGPDVFVCCPSQCLRSEQTPCHNS